MFNGKLDGMENGGLAGELNEGALTSGMKV
jgi:hypothetical protein